MPDPDQRAATDAATGAAAADAASFRAILTPHRSLSPRGFFILMAVISAVSFAAGLVFYRIGAWPVLGFFGLDVALIYGAFRLNYRAGRLVEVVEVTRDTLTLTRIHPSLRREEFAFNPYWVRVALNEDRHGRTHLALASHGRSVGFARFLSNAERRSFATALATALHAARGGARS